MSDSMKEAGNLGVFLNKTHVCPFCKEEANENEGMVISYPDLKGTYCGRCFAVWITNNIPQLVKKEFLASASSQWPKGQ